MNKMNMLLFIVLILSSCSLDESQFAELIDWATKNDAIINKKVLIKELSSDNHYLVANEKIEKDEVIFRIPNRLIIESDSSFAAKYCNNTDYYTCYVEKICSEMTNPSSFYRVYFDNLPRSFKSLPSMYDEEEKKLLEPSIIWNWLKKDEEWLTYSYQASQLNGLNFTTEDFTRCTLIAYTRTFGYGEYRALLAPLADLANYSPFCNTKWDYDYPTRSFLVKAKQDILPNEEIFVHYNEEDNAYNLIAYGFTIKDPKNKIIYQFQYNGNNVSLPTPPELFPSIESFKPTNTQKNNFIKNEKSALEALKTELQIFLQKYPTTLENDEMSYAKAIEENNYNKINIYRVLLEERKLLIAYIKLIDEISQKFTIGGIKNICAKKTVTPLYCKYLTDNFSKFKLLKIRKI